MKIKRGPLHVCAAPMCERMVNINNYCSVHLRRLQRDGDIDALNPIKRKERTNKQVIEDFSIPVTESGCWLWTASLGGMGYPIINLKGKYVTGHRLAYETFKGQIPDGMYVCHKCDVRSCVNPEHLFLATAKENTADMDKKGRAKRGSRWKPKLTLEQVRHIKYSGESPKKLSEKYGIAYQTVGNIRRGESWKHT